jgi:hypothetical protein
MGAYAFTVLVSIIPFVRALIRQKGENSYWEHVNADLKPTRRIDVANFQFTPRVREIFMILVFLDLFMLGSSISYNQGRHSAERWKDFQVIAKSTDVPAEVVVLRVYGDYLITAPIIRDPNGNEVETTLYILKLSEINKLPWLMCNQCALTGALRTSGGSDRV